MLIIAHELIGLSRLVAIMVVIIIRDIVQVSPVCPKAKPSWLLSGSVLRLYSPIHGVTPKEEQIWFIRSGRMRILVTEG